MAISLSRGGEQKPDLLDEATTFWLADFPQSATRQQLHIHRAGRSAGLLLHMARKKGGRWSPDLNKGRQRVGAVRGEAFVEKERGEKKVSRSFTGEKAEEGREPPLEEQGRR